MGDISGAGDTIGTPEKARSGRLDGWTILVTGGARRVGRAITEALVDAGAEVLIHAAHAHEEARELAASLPRAHVFDGDLSTAEGCAHLLDAVRRHLARTGGRLDGLVNNAAAYERAPFVAQSDALWESMLSLNLMAPVRLIREALPLGLRACVNLTDVGAERAWRNHAAYQASKAALAQLTRSLALELAPSVRINAVAPGTVAFPPDFTVAEQAPIVRRIPLGRVGTPADVGRAVRFLLVEDYLTGVTLPVDGGASLA